MATDTEMKQRLVRIETRLVRLAEALGHKVVDERDMQVYEQVRVVDIPDLDMSLSTVINAVTKTGYPHDSIDVHYHAECVATLNVRRNHARGKPQA